MDLLKSEKARRTKGKILKAAEELLMRRDISKVSVNDIVQKADVAKGTFYLYFESKEDLAWSIVQEGAFSFDSEIEKMINEPLTKENVAYLISSIIQFCLKNKELLMIIHHVKFWEFINKKQADYIEEKYIGLFKAWLDQNVAEGAVEIPDTAFYARFIFISIHEILERMILGKLEYDLRQAEKHVIEIVYKILGW
ncbi:DNA-binding transcriptional regulator, AcrR family [Evansella caseinilytica]|uniref:DNA-binding transcriptional regulator, AcrR family n=1 Tax=Evansella caseinilytica TaxID=1503961 RepID=A0A1H3GP53_9BACI|nr:TetR/AcrR family transcriptional regulator [Evansella caseinilytica]SDY04109.1 DNA-binding transcriptional regulator, AcrR family [Evansella caseinilytica]